MAAVSNKAKAPMKILYLSDVYFPRVNGVSTSIRTFVAQLQQMGHEVHLLQLRPIRTNTGSTVSLHAASTSILKIA